MAASEADPGDDSEISPAAFTSALASAANSVSIVTTRQADVHAGLTVSSLCSVCAEPPTMLACVSADNAFCPLAMASGYFAINMLAHGQQPLSNRFAGLNDPEPANRFSEGDWDLSSRQAPVLRNALVSLVCSINDSVRHGTHHVFFGHVIEVIYRDGEPLVYTARGYARAVSDPQSS